ncbi:MAG: transposase [Methylacidiphilales bacterium]|nr:transposase [Candidatus Methylacidiphilales bacterium]NJR14810.1 transposase [Calothrix sp. CSU_2_0]
MKSREVCQKVLSVYAVNRCGHKGEVDMWQVLNAIFYILVEATVYAMGNKFSPLDCPSGFATRRNQRVCFTQKMLGC